MISIIVPAFNEEKFLSDCLLSLKNQTFRGNFEIIFVNNCSTDNSVSLAQKAGVQIVNCKDKGLFYARKMGVEVSRGDIVVQADADTVYPGDWLSKIAEDFSRHPEVIAVAGRYIYREPPYWFLAEYWLRRFGIFLSLLFFKKPLIISGANFAFKKEIFLKIGGYSKDSFYFDQFDIANRLSKDGKVLYDKNLYVLTSPRRVQKPFIFVLADFCVNMVSALAYFVRFIFKIEKGQLPEKSSAKKLSFFKSLRR